MGSGGGSAGRWYAVQGGGMRDLQSSNSSAENSQLRRLGVSGLPHGSLDRAGSGWDGMGWAVAGMGWGGWSGVEWCGVVWCGAVLCCAVHACDV